MVKRICKLPESNSFFLFGARGTGKTTLLQDTYNIGDSVPKDTIWLDFLDPDIEEDYIRNPNLLKELLKANHKTINRVIIDEVQKVPAILDVVHFCIEKYKNIQFILTGSSARKLKSSGANMLGGRAFSIYLYPFSCLELPANYSLIDMLSLGTLPKLFEHDKLSDKKRFLKTYSQTYLKQEIQLEQLVRNVHSFRDYLEFAAQASGEIINIHNIANKSGLDDKTVARYFEILVDTLIGFFLEPYNESIRARQSQKPKFYLFDTGITRYLNHTSDIQLHVASSEYGKLFEQFFICECFKLNEYYEKNYRFYYLRTKDDAEIDLIVQKPGKKKILVEIKSSKNVTPEDYRHLVSLGKDMQHEELWLACNEESIRVLENNVKVIPWRKALDELFK